MRMSVKPTHEPTGANYRRSAMSIYLNRNVVVQGLCLGTVSIMGVYGSTYDNFPLHRIFDKGITLKMGKAPVLNYIDHLIELVQTEKVVLDDIITHTLPLSQVSHAYKIFDEKEEDCVKVVLKPGE